MSEVYARIASTTPVTQECVRVCVRVKKKEALQSERGSGWISNSSVQLFFLFIFTMRLFFVCSCLPVGEFIFIYITH